MKSGIRRTRPLAALAALLSAVLVGGTLPAVTGHAAEPIQGITMNLATGDILRGTKNLAITDRESAEPVSLKIDGADVPSTSAPAGIDIIAKVSDFQGGPANNFRNAIFVNGVKVSEPLVNVTGFNDLKVTVPHTAFTAGENTIQYQVGSAAMPNDPVRNNDDFDIRDVRLAFHDGTTASDPSIEANTVIRMGDSTGKPRTYDWKITVPPSAKSAKVSYAWDTTSATTGEHTVTATSADGARTAEAKVLVDQSADVHTNLRDRQILSGTQELIGVSDRALTFSVDGTDVPTTTRAVTNDPVFRFEADGWQASSFKNSIWLNGELIAVPRTGDVSGYRTIDVAIPAAKLKDGANTLRIRTGTANDTVDESGNANNDDFTVRNTRLEFTSGLELRDPVKSSQTLSIRDGLPPNPATATYFQDYEITVPAWAVTEHAATLDTATLADGEHVIVARKNEGVRTATATVLVDNTGPEITFAEPLEGAEIKQRDFTVDVRATDEIAGLDTLDLTLDGKPVKNGDTLTAEDLEDSAHTLTAVAIDKRGNRSEKSVTFTTIGNYPHAPTAESPANGATDQSTRNTDLAVTVADPAGDALDVDIKWAYRGDFATAAGVSAKGGSSTAATPTRGAGADLTDTDALKAKDGKSVTTAGEGAYPFHQFELAVPTDLAAQKYDVTWSGSVPAGQRVALSVWNHTTAKWELVADGKGGQDVTLTGRATVEDTVRGGKAQVLVQDVAASVISEKDAVFAWVTDTQFYSEREPDTYQNMLQWALDNRKSQGVGYGVHTGDIVNAPNSANEWKNASKVHETWDKANFPNGLVPGNHDIYQGNYEIYRTHFGEKRYQGKPWYGGTVDDNVQHYDLVSTPKADYLVMYLDWELGDDEIAWANKVIREHPEHNVVLATHQYITVGGAYYGPGQRIFDEIVLPNTNVDLILSGHIHGVAYNVKHEGERVIVEILQDYQGAPTAGGGWMRTINFDTQAQTVSNTTFSVQQPGNHFFDEKLENFTEPLQLEAPTRSVTTDHVGIEARTTTTVGSKANVASGSRVSVPAGALKPNSHYSWYAQATDADGFRATSDIWTFSTNDEPTLIPTTMSAGNVRTSYGTPARLRVSGLPAEATGTVTFREGDAVRCTARVVNGGATCHAGAALSVRTHPIVATYSGDSTHAEATASFDVTVVKAKPSMRVGLASSVKQGAKARVWVTLPTKATGSVRVTSNGRTLCTVRLSGGRGSCSVTMRLPKGNQAIYARYAGDSRYTAAKVRTTLRVR